METGKGGTAQGTMASRGHPKYLGIGGLPGGPGGSPADTDEEEPFQEPKDLIGASLDDVSHEETNRIKSKQSGPQTIVAKFPNFRSVR